MAVRKKRVPPSGYCERYPEWSNAKFTSFVRSNLRLMQRKWPPLQQKFSRALRRNKPADVVGRHKFEWQCEVCGGWFAKKNLQADHSPPCGSLKSLDDVAGFLDRMLAHESHFTRTCTTCHQIKTNRERNTHVKK